MVHAIPLLTVLALAALSSCAGARILAQDGKPQLPEVDKPQAASVVTTTQASNGMRSVRFQIQTDSHISLHFISADLVTGILSVLPPADIPAGSPPGITNALAESKDSLHSSTQGTLSFQVADEGQPTACVLNVYWRNPISGSREYSCTGAPGSNCDKVSCLLIYHNVRHDTLRTIVERKA